MSPPPLSSSTEAPDPSDARSQALRREYLAESPEHVRDLSAALGRLRARDPGALQELLLCFEGLATSAGSHGLAEIASLCRTAEHAVAALAHQALPLGRSDFVTLEQHVLGVADAFRIAQRSQADGEPR